jgi:hypothetical protein
MGLVLEAHFLFYLLNYMEKKHNYMQNLLELKILFLSSILDAILNGRCALSDHGSVLMGLVFW